MQTLRAEIFAAQRPAMLQEVPSPCPLLNPLLRPHWRFASVSPSGREGEAIPSPHVGEKVRMRGVHWNSTKTSPFEMHLAGVFLPKPACRLDQRREEQSNARAFLIIDADCAV